MTLIQRFIIATRAICFLIPYGIKQSIRFDRLLNRNRYICEDEGIKRAEKVEAFPGSKVSDDSSLEIDRPNV